MVLHKVGVLVEVDGFHGKAAHALPSGGICLASGEEPGAGSAALTILQVHFR